MRIGRCGVRSEGLAHADGLQLAQGVGDASWSSVRNCCGKSMTARAMPSTVCGPACAQIRS
ncbi:hypothetical protein ACLQ2E_16715 [Streptomyces lavendulocolor]